MSGPSPPATAPRPLRVMVSCGETSGDLYAGALADALRAQDPQTEIVGFGGPRLAAAGAELIGGYGGLSVTGLVEALAVVPRSWLMLRALREAARTRRPDVFVAIDFPDFNFRLLPAMRELGIPIVYYVSPQVWAWREGRLKTLRRYVDQMLVIFPFETEIYERAGVPVEFVGHPLVDLAVATRPRTPAVSDWGLDPFQPLVALLPGSRPNEVRRILPVLVRAMAIIRAHLPDVQFVIARAPGLEDRLFAPVEVARQRWGRTAIVQHATDDVLAAAHVAVVASGTATIQAALHQRPMLIVYRLSPLTYAMGRPLIRLTSFGMVNLVAGRPVVPELIQARFTPENVARETLALLSDRSRIETMREGLADVKRRLGEPGATARAADAVRRVALRRRS